MPSLHGRIIHKILFPLNEKREGTNILGALEVLEKSQYWSRERLAEWQFNRLKLVLNQAYEHTVLYRRRFDEIGFHPRDFRDFSDLRKLPLLRKMDLKNHLNELIADNYPEKDIHESTTGGTTADYTVFYRDNASLNFKLASTMRHDRWCGWDIGEKEAIVWPASIDFRGEKNWKSFIRNQLLDRRLRIFAGVLDEKTLHDICRQLERFRPCLMRGFPNPISVMADFIESGNRYHIQPGAIKSVGEPLSSRAREQFKKVFHCDVFDYYLSRESGTIASECEKHFKMHMNAETLYIEFLKNGQPVENGESGDVVVTDLFNLGMPFIRYQVGDIGAPVQGSCTCGRTLPLMEMGAGRESDYLISPHDGSLIMGLSLLVPLVENPKVGQLQIIQDERDHIILRIAKDKDFQTENMTLLEKTIGNIFHGKMRFTVEFVDAIPHDKSGKYRFAIRKEF
ncbi:MAG: phenylacetate--CoA ligase family protein [Thermodesulfobacteriota bacterium]